MPRGVKQDTLALSWGKKRPALHPALIHLRYTRENVQSDNEYSTQKSFQFPGGAKYNNRTLKVSM